MHVQMGHALADAIVHRHKRPLRFHSAFDGPGEPLGIREERPNQRARKIRERLDMLARNQQTMPRKQRPAIQKRNRDPILKNDVRGNRARDNLAKHARHGYRSTIGRNGRQ